jgi:hypothetical protein
MAQRKNEEAHRLWQEGPPSSSNSRQRQRLKKVETEQQNATKAKNALL